MKNILQKSPVVVTLTILSHVILAQQSAIRIKFIGNCGLYLSDGVSNIYIDFPYKSGAHHYMEYDRAELDSIRPKATFIFTHRHADHYSKKLLKKQRAQAFGPWNLAALETWAATVPDFSIQPFKTRHQVYGISFKHDSYLLTWHGKRIYISGDTEQADTLATQQNIDWAFVPAWLVSDALRKGIKLKQCAKNFAIYHIGPRDKISSDGKDDQLILLTKTGQRIVIPY